MPAPRRPEYDTQEFIDAWVSRVPIRVIAERYGVSMMCVWRAAMRRGLPRRSGNG